MRINIPSFMRVTFLVLILMLTGAAFAPVGDPHFVGHWQLDDYTAIDQGPIVVMIENYRTQLCWNLFMTNPEIQPMLDATGWTNP